MLLFDLDRFKSINDRFGHPVGDEVLRLFARVARASLRTDDIIARFGGEEFAVVVGSSAKDAVKIANRVRLSFEAAGVVVNTHAIGATVSIGTATAQAPVTDIDALIQRADAALYRAKGDGRNRVCAAEEPQMSPGARLIAAARASRTASAAERKPLLALNARTPTQLPAVQPILLDEATAHLPYRH